MYQTPGDRPTSFPSSLIGEEYTNMATPGETREGEKKAL